MNLYTKLKEYESASQNLDMALIFKERAKNKIEKITPAEVESLVSRAQHYCSELRKIHEDKKNRGIIQRHTLNDYFDEEKISEFNTLVKNLGYSETEFLSDWERRGIVLKTTKDTYKLIEYSLLMMGVGLLAPVSGAFGYIFAIGIKGSEISGVAGAMIGISACGLLLACAAVCENSPVYRNPFERLAQNLEKRVEYVKTNFSSFRQKNEN